MVLSFGEVLMDCFPDKRVIGGAPLNVVTHLKRLRIDSGIISKIGKDELGDQILTFLQKEGLDEQIQVSTTHGTGRVDVTLNNGQPSYEIKTGTAWDFISYQKLATQPDFFVFGSLALLNTNNQETFKAFKQANPDTQFLCDINLRAPFYNKESILLCLTNADILKINDEELDYLAAENNIEDGIAWLKSTFGIHKILLTKGKDGAELFWNDKHYNVDVSPVNELKDTVGAGDSFTAIFIYGLLNNWDLNKTLKAASKFASRICETSGAIPSDLKIYQGL